MGALGGIWEPACLDCPSVHSSIFPNFILLSPPSFLLSVSLSLLLSPSPLASSAHSSSPFHSGGYSENTMQAQLCQAHTPYLGMAPLPAQGKPRAWPTPHSLPSPWTVCWPIRGSPLSVSTPLVSPVCLSMLGGLLESKTVGSPWLVVRGSLVSLSLHYALPHPPQGLQPCTSCIPELRLL